MSVEVSIEAWFSARIEYVETSTTIAVVTYCRVCNNEVLRRTYDKMPENPSATEMAEAEAVRRADARADGLLFFQHLQTQHPEKFEFGDVVRPPNT